MYKVLLVDDEALIREAISENIKWEEHGFEFLGACENGKEAIDRINQEVPDLLITDICMPYVDGMELTKYVYETYPLTKVIIISGYDEFEYAKTAVKYKVLEYVLKPITAFELTELLDKIKTDFDKESLKNKNLKKIREAYMSNLPVLKGRFLNSLMQGNLLPEDIKKKSEDYGVDLSGRYFATAMIQGDDLEEYLKRHHNIKEDLVLFSIYNITEEIVSKAKCGVTFQNGEDKTIVIFQSDKEEGFRSRVFDICTQIRSALNQYLKIDATIGIGKTVATISWLNRSLESARAVLEYRFLLGGNVVLDARELGKNKTSFGLDISVWVDKILLSIKAGDTLEIEKVIQSFVLKLKTDYVSKNRIIIYIQNIVLSIVNMLEEAGLSNEEFMEGEYTFINRIYMLNHLKDIENELIGFCIKVSQGMTSEKDSYGNRQAIMALDYIDKNYSNSEVSLNSVCHHLAMSTSYFSSIFKNYTGETFIEALTKKRIEKAKSLIEHTSLKSYEVANEVGFGDPHYFSIIFKKHTGYTPTEYAKIKRK
ncbi:response regulator [Candidatus Galacturonibacter soehngenii]|uniref:Stage 0 sporulation protein A homolog n=1 Tax=Candidatus Galacturonatibacter soehngenii TaxID=2307010 RepID=A0A7V7QI85_9FIRM|nr:response regulator [Candidatus Galacturonibacter soehngenii]KAB1435838.1 response regulator [Candidatus Galacturonibacter soehngenii]MBA4686580.1 response regulator [Candidatus Galacturonibacter soehngenii]